MKKLVIPVLLLTISFGATAQETTTPPVMKSLLDSFSYAAGYNIALNMKEQGITELNSDMVKQALDDVFQNKTPQLNSEQVNSSLQHKLQEFAKKRADAAKAAGIAFLGENKKRPGVTTLPSGLQYEVLVKGNLTSNKPKPEDTVVVNYIGSLIDGKEFNNSFKDGQPAVFPVTRVIKGWTEALQLMNVGARWKIYVPTELAYDMNPRDPNVIPPGAALVFEIQLEGIKPAGAAQPGAHTKGDGHNH